MSLANLLEDVKLDPIWNLTVIEHKHISGNEYFVKITLGDFKDK